MSAVARNRKPVRRSPAGRPSQGLSRGALLWRSTRRTLARVPTAAWVCALLAFCNAAAWSIVTPPLLAIDEQDHFAYVQQLAETGRLPSSGENEFSREETVALEDLHHRQVRFRPAGHPIFSQAEQRKLQADLAAPLSRRGPGGTGVSATEPPLYYALASVPYKLGSSGSLLDRLALVRLLSAALAGLTALFVFLFLTQALPAAPWAWTVGGLGAALAPLLGYASSGVNPDALLFAVCAALLCCLARAFRHGLTRRLALGIGGLVALGFLSKLNFVGVAPGALLGLVLLTRRAARSLGAQVYYRWLAPALAIALSPAVLYGLVNLLSNHRAFGIASSGVGGATGGHGSLSDELSYIWQFYLPRLPGMRNDIGEVFVPVQIWFRNFVGLYGWSDTPFPGWVYNLALVPAGALALLCARALVLDWGRVPARVTEIVTYAVMGVGLMLLTAASGYLQFPAIVAEFTDARYALPMLALWAAVLALAARGAGRRWGPAVGALIVVLVLAHDIFSQLQVIARYYG